MELKICSFELAKLLKEKGFNHIECNYYENYKEYDYDDDAWHLRNRSTNTRQAKIRYLAPTLELAKMWLQKEYDLRIEVHISNISQIYYCTIYDLKSKDSSGKFKAIGVKGIKDYSFQIDNKALEAGILEALKLIK